MDRDQVNNVAHFPASGRRHRLVHGEVNRVQDVPFEPCDVIAPPNFRGVNERHPAKPDYLVARGLQGLRIVQGCDGHAFFAVVKEVDIV
jgi:hypothetical protein